MMNLEPQIYSTSVCINLASKWLAKSLNQTKLQDIKNDINIALSYFNCAEKYLNEARSSYSKNVESLIKLLGMYKKELTSKNISEIKSKIESLFYEIAVLDVVVNSMLNENFKLLTLDRN